MDENFEINRQHAYRAHDAANSSAIELFKSVISTGINSLRLLSVVNAGAIIALLAFIGQIAGKDKQVFAAGVFVTPITYFAGGLIFSILATAGIYFAQWFFAEEVGAKTHTFTHPYVHETEASKRWSRAAIGARIFCIFNGLVSFFAFLMGVCSSIGIVATARL